MIHCHCEPLARLLPELPPLLQAHWDESEAALDGLYLAPAARKGLTVLRLLRTAEAGLRERGADMIQYSSPASRPCDVLYRRLGARHTESVWHKELC